tara:strand:- start:6930 stop:7118 length:189 start_codon:yes stop_codon:yes gene_type:complete
LALTAAEASYALIHGITKETVFFEIWRQIFCIVGGGCVGVATWMGLTTGVRQPARYRPHLVR